MENATETNEKCLEQCAHAVIKHDNVRIGYSPEIQQGTVWRLHALLLVYMYKCQINFLVHSSYALRAVMDIWWGNDDSYKLLHVLNSLLKELRL